ncbi:MAG: glycosyltransferase, partial [Pseudonocardiales bacterium]|nr:glycosyltransferase [Pseudonocardiales bacterium]
MTPIRPQGQGIEDNADRRLRVLVVIHHLEIGGSQMAAIDLASGVHDLGHEVLVAGPPGVLLDVIKDRGLRFEALEYDLPGRAVRRAIPGYRRLLEVTRAFGPDLVHTYELTPSLLTFVGAHLRDRVPMTMTVNSMAVPDFMPGSVPLQVCSPLIASEIRKRSGSVGVLEIPTDCVAQFPDYPGGSEFRSELGVAPDELMVVVVSRFARALKQEGLETAVRAAARLAPRHRMRLVLVGDG